MKKNILLLLTSFLFLTDVQVQGQEWSNEAACRVDQANFYGELWNGANFLQNSSTDGNNTTFDAGYIIAGSLGYRWQCGIHLEAEYAFRRNAIRKIDFYTQGDSSNGHFQSSSYMANLLWDLPLSYWGCGCENIHPFIGAGLGYDSQEMSSSNSRIIFYQDWSNLSWQVMAGLTYPIFCNTEMNLEYKFHQGGCNFYSHSLGIGLAYKFGFSCQ